MLGGNAERFGPLGVESLGQNCADALDAVVLTVLPGFGNVVEVTSSFFIIRVVFVVFRSAS